ncbi:protein AHNAK2 [Rhynchocyon petersi]
MCDCFHLVLPTWPGAPGSESGRQLQPEAPEAETEEDHSVTEGPVDEIIRPRPQGSSPVYECAAEGAGFGFQEEAPGRRVPSGRRRSWWKRDSGDSRTFSRMSHQESVQGGPAVTLKTEVEVGASGYSITGGGDQGIFVRQVLKDSSAARLFSFREGDQLLSTTIFFDDIKYEDALKILQYSEPYKVQFRIRRKIPGKEEARRVPEVPEKQDKEVTEGSPTKTLEGGGDQDRLLPKSREGRSRKPQERFSWPKFQAIRPKHRAGPRRSHSSSEAYERGTRDLSPTSTDTEAQHPEEGQEPAHSEHRRQFLSLRFRTLSGRPGKGVQGEPVPGVLEEVESQDTGPTLSTELSEGAAVSGGVVGTTTRHRKKTRETRVQEEEPRQRGPGGGPVPQQAWEDSGVVVQKREVGIAKLSLQDPSPLSSMQSDPPEIRVRIPYLQTPRFVISNQKVLDKETDISECPWSQKPGRLSGEGPGAGAEGRGGASGASLQGQPAEQDRRRPSTEEKDQEVSEGKRKMPKFKIPSFGWSPSKEADIAQAKPPQETVDVQLTVESSKPRMETKEQEGHIHDDKEQKGTKIVPGGREVRVTLEENVCLAEKDVTTKDSKFKMPKFKMPSFGLSGPGKSMETSVDTSLPQTQEEASDPSMEGGIRRSDLSIQLTPVHEEVKQGDEGVKLHAAQRPKGELSGPYVGVELKGHLPKIPSARMPSVNLKGPQVDITSSKTDLKSSQVAVSLPEVDMSLPKVEVGTTSPRLSVEGVRGEGPNNLVHKDLKSKGDNFQISSFKMPSFGMSAPSKTMETSFEVSLPRAQLEVCVPSMEVEVEPRDLSSQLPSANMKVKGGEVGTNLSEGQLLERELSGQAVGIGLKGHLPKVQMPEVKIAKVDTTAPQLEIKSPKVNLKGPNVQMKDVREEVATPDTAKAMPHLEVDIQPSSTKVEVDLSLGDKDLTSKDSKLKMPKFKMPSFGGSTPSKPIAILEGSVPTTVEGSVPSMEGAVKPGELTVQLPSGDMVMRSGEVATKLKEGHLPEGEPSDQMVGTTIKGHLPKFQMPEVKMPKVDVKVPQLDIEDPKVDLKGPKVDRKDIKGEVDPPDIDKSLPSVEVDIKVPSTKVEGDLSLGDKDLISKDSKFKMPKFKMPSFGGSTPSKRAEVSLDMPLSTTELEVSVPSMEGVVKPGDLSGQLPSGDMEVKGSEMATKLKHDHLPEGELSDQTVGLGIKGQLPKSQMPGVKMPKVDIKAPQPDIKGPKVDLKGPKVAMKELEEKVAPPDIDKPLPSVEVDIQAPRVKVEGDHSLGDKDLTTKHSKFKMPKLKMPTFGGSTPSKPAGASLDVSLPTTQVEVSVPSMEGAVKPEDLSVQVPPGDMEMKGGDVSIKQKEVHIPVGEHSGQTVGTTIKGHLPKFHMPGVKMAKVDIKAPQLDIKGPKVDLKAPKVDRKDIKREVAPPDIDKSLPSLEVDIQAQSTKVEGDLSLGDKDLISKDSKFKMPKFKMPSFGGSTPSKSAEASLDMSLPTTQVEVSVPSMEGAVKPEDLSVQLPSGDMEVKGSDDVSIKLKEGHIPERELSDQTVGTTIKGHLPKFQMPGVKMPKLKGPKVDMKDLEGTLASADINMSLPSVEVDIEAPSNKVEDDLSLGDKDLTTKDIKFKMPKLKMPSFGGSTPSKPAGASMDVSLSMTQVEVSVPSMEGEVKPGDLSVQLPSGEMDVKGGDVSIKLKEGHIPERELSDQTVGTTIKGQLPKFKMPGVKMPKVDIKVPQSDIKDHKVDHKGPKVDRKDLEGKVAPLNIDTSLPSVEVDIEAPSTKVEGDISLGEKGLTTKDSKFKMPKLMMPSFGVSTPSKHARASLDVSLPTTQVEVSVPSMEGAIKTGDLSVQFPSGEMEVKGSNVSMKVKQGHMPEGEHSGQTVGTTIKGHLPEFQMPGVKMPKVDIKATQQDTKGPKVDLKGPKVDMKGLEGKVAPPDIDMSLPSVEVDIEALSTKEEGDLSLGDKNLTTRDSKFKMPKLKMPSFRGSTPSKPAGASLDVSLPTTQVEVSVSSMEEAIKPEDLSVQLPSGDMEVKGSDVSIKLKEGHIPERELSDQTVDTTIKGQLPKFQMPGVKMPKVDIKAPQLDISGPKVDLKGPKMEMKDLEGKVAPPDIDMALPTVEVDIKAPSTKVDSDLSLEDKALTTKDSKFKMSKFKMPSFGVSTPSKPAGASLDVSLPTTQVEVSVPSMEEAIKPGDLTVQQPPGDMEMKADDVSIKQKEGHSPGGVHSGQTVSTTIKGHLPKFHMPGVKMPKVDIKAPQLDIKGPKVDLKAPKVDRKDIKGEVAPPDIDKSLPSLEVDIQAQSTKVEGDLSLGDKDLTSKDGKFKLPKFKMPSFGGSTPSKPAGASLDMTLSTTEVEVSVPSMEGAVKPEDLSVQLPSGEMEVNGSDVSIKLKEGHIPEGELSDQTVGTTIKGHLPKFQMPGVKMPKVDIKGPQLDIKVPKVDLKGPKVTMKDLEGTMASADIDMSLSSVEVDIEALSTKVEGDLSLGDKDLTTKDIKFKMPKLKMPSFGESTPSKPAGASLDVSLPTTQVEVSVPSMEGEVKPEDLNVQLPSGNMEMKGADLSIKKKEGHMPEVELSGQTVGTTIKGHLPKFQMPGVKMPKVDIMGPKVDLKGSKVAMKDLEEKVAPPDIDMSLPSVEVDIQAPSTKVEGDLSLGDKDLTIKDSKFKMPKFKMPSFGGSTPSKPAGASLDMPLSTTEVEVSVPSMEGAVKPGDLSVEHSSGVMEVKGSEMMAKLKDGHLPEGELSDQAVGIGIKGQLPKLQMPGVKMPKVDIKAPQLDIKGPKVDLKGPKVAMKDLEEKVASTDIDMLLPSVQVDIKAPSTKVEGDLSLGDKDLTIKDSKFKMPKFKMPSFGGSTPSRPAGASLDMPLSTTEVEASVPFMEGAVKPGDLSAQLPSGDMEVKASEMIANLKDGHLPEGELSDQTVGIGIKGQLPKFQLPGVKMPSVDIKAPQLDIKGPKVDLKGPKVDMKDLEEKVASTDIDMSLPSVQVDVEASSTKVEGDLSLGDKDLTTKDIKFKMPKLKMPSFGGSTPSKPAGASLDVSLPTTQVEVSVSSLEGAIRPGEFSVQGLSGDMEVKGADVPMKLNEGHIPEGELSCQTVGSTMKGHMPKVQMPGVKMPKVDIKVPQLDIKGPKVDLKGPKVDMKELKGKGAPPDIDMSLPSVQVDIEASSTKVEGDLPLGDKDLMIKDSKFKMPKFKMPSFGGSTPSKPAGVTLDVSLPTTQVKVSVPPMEGSSKPGDLSVQLPSGNIKMKGADVSIKKKEGHMPEGKLSGQTVGTTIKGHLPKFQMPGVKMPKVDIMGPKVDHKGPKVAMKDLEEKVAPPDIDMSLPSVEVDIQAPSTKVEGDLPLGDKDLTFKDSKFKMPKFKMPSFGGSTPSKPAGASLDMPLSTTEVEVSVPSMEGAVKPGDLSVQLPSGVMEVKGSEMAIKLKDGHLPEGELSDQADGIGIKGQLPKLQMPGVKMPSVDIKAPLLDIKGPKVDLKGPKVTMKDLEGKVTPQDIDMSLPSVEVDVEASSTKVEGDLPLGDKDLTFKDSKFKMPKFKMPSFGGSTPSKPAGASLDMPLSTTEVEASVPSMEGAVKPGDLSVEHSSGVMEVKGSEMMAKLRDGHLPEGELSDKAVGIGIKGQLPKFQMPGVKMPSVDIKAPQLDIKGPKVDLKGPKVDMKDLEEKVASTDIDMSLPSVQVDVEASSTKVEGDLSLGDKDLTTKDIKFKMPKVKMPSFGGSTPSKPAGASLDMGLSTTEVELSVPSMEGAVKPGDLSVQVPSGDMEVKVSEMATKLKDGHLPEGELSDQTVGIGIKGQLSKFQLPGVKMPKVDINAPQLDIKGPKVDLKGPKVNMKDLEQKVALPDTDMSLPSVQVDIQALSTEIEGDLFLGDKDLTTKDSKFKMPKFKMPSFGGSTPSKPAGASLDMALSTTEVEVSVPSMEGAVKPGDLSVQLPSGDMEVKGSEMVTKLKDGHLPEGELSNQAVGIGIKGQLPKFQLPGVKMPKADIKAPQLDIKGPKVDLKGPKVDMKDLEGTVVSEDIDMPLPSVEVDIEAPSTKEEGDLSLEDKDLITNDSKFKMPKFKVPSFGGSTPSKHAGGSLDASLPTTQVEVSVPSLEGAVKPGVLSAQLPSGDLELKGGDVSMKLKQGHMPEGELSDQIVGTTIKGHLPKFQMPGVKMPKIDIKAPHLDIKGPKVDLKGPKVTMKDLEGKVAPPDIDMSLPIVEVDVEAPSSTEVEGDLPLGDNDLTTKDSKFKMPKFKMPSFSGSAASKPAGASLDISLSTTEVEASVPSMEGAVKPGDLSVQLPSGDMDVKASEMVTKLKDGHLLEGELSDQAVGIGIKGQLPKFQLPGVKMPSVDIKAPQLDIKGPKVDLKSPKVDMKDLEGKVAPPDIDMSLPGVEVDIEAPSTKVEGDLSLGDKDLTTKDIKFKMPKLKMPSFGGSTPSKPAGASLDVSLPTTQVEVSVPFMEGAVKPGDLSVQLLSGGMEVKGSDVSIKLKEGHIPERELSDQTVGTTIKGQLPMFQMPGVKMPKVDIKAPQLDISGPKVDLKGPKMEMKDLEGKVAPPDIDMALPTVEVDVKAPSTTVDSDLSLEDKALTTKDSKFKMSKFKMPSFGVSTPSKPAGASLDVSLPTTQVEVSVPSMEEAIKPGDLTVQQPPGDMEMKADDVSIKQKEGHSPGGVHSGQTVSTTIKGHLPKFHMPGVKMPKVDIKTPQLDIKGPKVDLKAPKVDRKDIKGEVAPPDIDKSLPSLEVDIQAQSTKVEGDLSLGDKDLTSKDSKFKLPKFKMPSFGGSTPSKPAGASLDMALSTTEVEASVPFMEGAVKPGDLSVEHSSGVMEVKDSEMMAKLRDGHLPEGELSDQTVGIGIKGQLPKFQMPGAKMARVDTKAPQLDIKGPNVELTGPKVDLKDLEQELAPPAVDVSLPCMQIDIQAPVTKVEGDLSLRDKDLTTKDSKFQMPSLSVSSPSKSFGASDITSLPEVQVEVSVSPVEGTLKSRDLSVELPSADVEIMGNELAVKLPEDQLPGGEFSGSNTATGLKGHLPKSQMPGVTLSGFSSVKHDLCGLSVETSLPSPSDGITLTKYQVTVPVTTMHAGLPEDPVSVLHPDTPLPSTQGLVEVQPQDRAPEPQVDTAFSPVGSLAPVAYGRVTFPKFYKPRFGFSVMTVTVPEDEDVGSVAQEKEACLPSSTAPLSADILVLKGPEDHSEPDVTAAAEDSERSGKSSPFKMPRFKLPSLSRSPKKETGPQGDPEGKVADAMPSLGEDPTQTSMQTGVPVPLLGEDADLPPEMEGMKRRPKKSSFAMPKLHSSKVKGKDGPSWAQAEVQASPSGSSAATEWSSDHGVAAGGTVKVEDTVNQPEATPSHPEHGPSLNEDSMGHGLKDNTAPLPSGESMASPKGETWPSPGAVLDTEGHPVENPMGAAQVTEVTASSQDSWFRVPRFRMPGFWRTATKGKGRAASDVAQGPGPQGEEGSAGAQTWDACAYQCSAEAASSPQLTDTETDGMASKTESQPGILELSAHGPIAEAAAADLAGPEARIHPGEGSLQLWTQGRPSELHPPPGETEETGPPRAGGQPEGPVTLRTTQTQSPARVSILRPDCLWEDSVVSVTFPKLKVPRFTLRAPSTDADVFVPSVREGTGSDAAPQEDSPGAWVASILQPFSAGEPAAPAVSKVRVHIQGAQAESQAVTVCSRGPPGPTAPSPPDAFSTQIVRESQIPETEVQTPAYGFSLLKVKIPDPPTQTLGSLATRSSQAGAGPGADPVSPDAQPDGEEPFEVICADPAARAPAQAQAGQHSPDSCSDGEPAEILEFPSQDDQGAAEERPAGEKKAGLLRFWLPNIGFSSSVEETRSPDSKDEVPGPAPVQTQPEARPPERGGWFRFPRLGFSSPTQKTKSADVAEPEEQKLPEETVVFFDACESLSPEDKEGGPAAAPGQDGP